MKTMNSTLRIVAALAAVIAMTLAADATTYTWNVATAAANNWNVNGNWDGANYPGFGGSTTDNAIFGQIGTSSSASIVNNIVSVDTTVAALSYTNAGSSAYNVTQIPTGVTLTVSGSFTNGGLIGVSTGFSTSNSMTGGGTFLVTGTNLRIGNNNTTGGTASSLLDLSGLSNFVYNSSGGTINLGNQGSRSVSSLYLAAASNSITAGTININVGGTSTGTSGNFNLGGGTNIINASTINLAAARNTTPMQFSGATGGLRIRGTGGTDADRATIVVGNRNTAGSSTITVGSILANDHPVDMKLSTLTMGQAVSSSAATGPIGGTGTLLFNQGIVDVTTINMAITTMSNATAIGTITVGTNATSGVGGLLTIGAGGLSLVNFTPNIANAATGTLYVAGGTVTCAGSITKTTINGTGNIIVSNGTLNVSGTIGTAAVPVNSLSLNNATLTLPAAVGAQANVTALNAGGTTNTINVSSVPAITVYPTQFPLIKYAGASGDLAIIGLGTLLGIFQGYVSNNTGNLSIDVVLTGGPAPAKPVTWTGAASADWNITAINWLSASLPATFNQNDFALFDDTAAGPTAVNLAADVSIGGLTNNSSTRSYSFIGNGKITGAGSLTKQGASTLVLNNSGANDFSGGVLISGGTLQVGNGNTNGSLPATSAVADNGGLVFNRSDSVTVANVVSGTGTLTNSGSGTLTLSSINSFSGGLTVNAGTVRANHPLAAGMGTMTVKSGGTLVLGATNPNATVLAGGTLGVSVAQNPSYVSSLTAAAGTTSTLYTSDPQNLTANLECYFTNLLGSGNITVLAGTVNTNVDGGVGFRLRGTASTFSGTLMLGNNVKGEMQAATAGPFSPAGTGKIVMTCGAYNGTNNVYAPAAGGFSELNVRNNYAGDTVFGNNVEITASGLAVLNMAGSAPAGAVSTLGDLKVGGGQQVGVYKSSGTVQTVKFQTVTLTGGNATFSPFTPGFGATTNASGNLTLGPISELTPGSGITMAGLLTLYLTGANTYTGNTFVNSGTLALQGSGSISTSPTITIASGATLDASGRSDGTLTLASGQTLKGNGLVVGTLAVGSGSTLAAGASVGLLTNTGSILLQSGGSDVVEVIDASGAPGTGYDSVGVSGDIGVQATPAGKFTVKLVSLNGAGTAGAVTNFNKDASYSWTIASGNVTNFDANAFTINTTGFSNDLAGGYFFAESGSLRVSFTNNHPPAAAPATASRPKGLPLKIKLADLAVNWSDPDGDATAFVSVNPSSTNGLNNVTADSTQIYYSPGTNGNVPDVITYTIRDQRSAYRAGDTVRTAAGTILVTIAPPSTNLTHNITGISTNGDGTVTIRFAGVPNETYVVEAATNPAAPVWVPLSTNVAGPNGLWNYTDPAAASYPSRFYRSAHP